jgi:hypothetical protein
MANVNQNSAEFFLIIFVFALTIGIIEL